MLVQTFLSQPAVEAFHHRVVRRRATSGKVQLYAVFIRLAVHHLAGKLTAVIHFDRFRLASLNDQPRHCVGDIVSAQGLIHDDIQAFMREVVQHRQQPEATAIEQRVTNEVHAPQRVGRRGHLDRLPTTATATTSRATMPQRQAFFLVDAMHPLVVVPPAFAPQHDQHAFAAIVDARLRDLAHPQADGAAVARLGLVRKRRARHRHDPQCAPFAHAEALSQAGNPAALLGRP